MNEDEHRARTAAARIGIALPDECVAGVIDNLRLLARHAAVLETAPDDEGPGAA